MLRLKKKQWKALANFRNRVLKDLGDRIEAIVVYGSAARGEYREDSDIDVLIVGSDKEVKSKVSEISYEIDYENSFETFITPC